MARQSGRMDSVAQNAWLMCLLVLQVMLCGGAAVRIVEPEFSRLHVSLDLKRPETFFSTIRGRSGKARMVTCSGQRSSH